MNKLLWIIGVASVFFLSSCSEHDYRNAIPKNVQALMSMDLASAGFNTSKLKSELEQAGVDYSARAFLFETVDGNFGLCARMENEAKLKDWINKKTKENECESLMEYDGIAFSFYKDSWVIGYKDDTMLMMGPVLPDMKKQIQMQIIRLMSQEEKHGCRKTKMFETLDSLEAPIGLIAKISAIPEKIAVPFTVGLSQNTNLSQVYVLAEMQLADSVLHIMGHSLSFNKHTNEKLRKADKVFRPISRQATTANRHSFFSFVTNVEGPLFLEMLQRNESMKGLLSGMNASFDVNSVIKAIDGDLVIATSMSKDNRIRMAMKAELKDKAFLKQNWYTPSSDFFYATKDLDSQKTSFLCCNDKDILNQLYDQDLSKYLANQRLAMVFHLSALQDDTGQIAIRVANDLFGEDISTILYTLK